MPLTLARRALAGGAVSLAALSLAAPADAAYTPGIPGHIGVAAHFSTAKTAYPTSNPEAPTYASDRKLGTDAVSTSTPNWPPLPSPGPPPGTACPGGCAASDATAFASAQAGGVLQTYGRSTAATSGLFRASGLSETDAYLDDTITVNQATTVVLRGRIRARIDAGRDRDRAGAMTWVRMGIRVGHCDGENCMPEGRGIWETFDSRGTVDRTFEVPIEIPEGTSPVNARLESHANSWASEDTKQEGSANAHAKADATETNSDVDKLEFEIVVPDDVVVTSGSGKLPVVGGRDPEPTDTTPPVINVPAPITTDATGPAGATVRYSATAVDETSEAKLACTPASGTRFAAGTTTVTCTATDAAGNTATKTFPVTVRSAADLLAALRTQVESLPRSARNALLPLIPAGTRPTCGRMLLFGARTLTLVPRQLDLFRALRLVESATRVARAAGC